MRNLRVHACMLDSRQTVVGGSLLLSRRQVLLLDLSPPSSPLVIPSCRFLEVRSVCTRLAFLPVHRRAFIGLAFTGSWGYDVLSRARMLHRQKIAPRSEIYSVSPPSEEVEETLIIMIANDN